MTRYPQVRRFPLTREGDAARHASKGGIALVVHPSKKIGYDRRTAEFGILMHNVRGVLEQFASNLGNKYPTITRRSARCWEAQLFGKPLENAKGRSAPASRFGVCQGLKRLRRAK